MRAWGQGYYSAVVQYWHKYCNTVLYKISRFIHVHMYIPASAHCPVCLHTTIAKPVVLQWHFPLSVHNIMFLRFRDTSEHFCGMPQVFLKQLCHRKSSGHVQFVAIFIIGTVVKHGVSVHFNYEHVNSMLQPVLPDRISLKFFLLKW